MIHVHIFFTSYASKINFSIAYATPSSLFVFVTKSAISFRSGCPFSITTPVPTALIFIEMEDDAAAAKAIAELNGAEYMGRTMVVKEARPRA